MRSEEFISLHEAGNLKKIKQEIIQAIDQIDTDTDDQEEAKKNLEILDRVYTVLHKTKVLDRVKEVIPTALKGDFEKSAAKDIAEKIANAPMHFKDKLKVLDNLEKNKVVDEKILLKPGNYTIDQLTFNDKNNKALFDHFKDYGVGQKMKGPGEYGLIVLNQKITEADKGDIRVDNTLVEVKASVVPSGNGGRLGEGATLPSRDRVISLLNTFTELRAPIDEHLSKQKSLNVRRFVEIMNEQNLPVGRRRKIASALFSEFFGPDAKLVINEISKKDADPKQVAVAYAMSNFAWYKRTGGWQVLVAIAFARNAMVVLKEPEDLQTAKLKFSTPAIITTGKPLESLFQLAPR